MKRSRSIRLVLVGGLSAGALTSCNRESPPIPIVSAANVYTNNYHVPGVGYYHAPFRAWYPTRYNEFNAQTGQYFYGGAWHPAPHESITNLSSPDFAAAQQAESTRTDISRGGFGRTSGYNHIWS